jgi:hypothetical protein
LPGVFTGALASFFVRHWLSSFDQACNSFTAAAIAGIAKSVGAREVLKTNTGKMPVLQRPEQKESCEQGEGDGGDDSNRNNQALFAALIQ